MRWLMLSTVQSYYVRAKLLSFCNDKISISERVVDQIIKLLLWGTMPKVATL